MQQKVLFVFLLMTAFNAVAGMPENCNDPDTKETVVYNGWPFTLHCNDLLWDFSYDVYGGSMRCTIIDISTGTVLVNESTTFEVKSEEYIHPNPEDFEYKIDDVDQWTSTSYELVASSEDDPSICMAEFVNLNITDFVERTCNESVEDDDVTVDNIDKQVGETTTLRCDVPGHFTGPQELVEEEEADTQWLYNCGTELPDNSYDLDDPKHALLLTNISYQTNPGVYTCVVKHRGMTRHRIHYKVCVKDQVSREITIKCPDYKAAIGQDLVVECDVDAGLGIENTFVFHSFFNKLDENRKQDKEAENVSCTAFANKNDTISPNERISCNLTTSTVGGVNPCFYTPPTKEEYQAQKTMLKMYYKIKNVQTSDLGEYNATIARLQNVNSTLFKIALDLQPGLEKSTIIIIICMSVLLGCGLFIFMLFILCGIEIRWVWKRSFGSRETETKRYAGYLAYYYSKDMPETSPTDLDAFVKNLETRVKRLGGNLYDKCRDHTNKQYIAENIHAMLTQCHRVIIILTPEYIRDQWSVYEAYEAWKNVIEHGIPIIFITLPTTASAIEGLPTESKVALNKALKRHSVIEWNGNFPFTRRMRMRLEILMPKLPLGGGVERNTTDNVREDIIVVKMHNGDSLNGGLDSNKNVYENAV